MNKNNIYFLKEMWLFGVVEDRNEQLTKLLTREHYRTWTYLLND